MPRSKAPNALEGLHVKLAANASLWEKWTAANSILEWPSKKTTGVISMEALRLNSKLISEAAAIWVPQKEFPKTFPVDALKTEAC